MPLETLERVTEVRLWMESVAKGCAEWRGTLRMIGASGAPDLQILSFHGRSGLLDGVGALIPIDDPQTSSGNAQSGSDSGD